MLTKRRRSLKISPPFSQDAPLPPLLVVAVALLEQDDAILLHRRPQAAVHGGLWEFPGGKVEPGESPPAAAARELAEELGVLLQPGQLRPVGFASGEIEAVRSGEGRPEGPARSMARSTARSMVILLYACRRWQGEPTPHPDAAVAWYRPEEIAGLAMPPLDYPLAETLRTFLSTEAT